MPCTIRSTPRAGPVLASILVILTAIAIYLQYDTVVYAYVSALFPTLKGL